MSERERRKTTGENHPATGAEPLFRGVIWQCLDIPDNNIDSLSRLNLSYSCIRDLRQTALFHQANDIVISPFHVH